MRNKFYSMKFKLSKFTRTETISKLKFVHIDPFWNRVNLKHAKVTFRTMRSLSQNPAYKFYKKRKKNENNTWNSI